MDPTDRAIKGFYCSRSLKYFVPSWKSLYLLLQAWKSLWCVLRSSSTQNGTESHMPYKTLETNCWVSKGHDWISISFHQNWEITALYSITIFHEEDLQIFYTPRFNEVDRGVYWYHLVRLSVRPSVRLWTESCPLCIFKNTHRIHFIFAHLIKQLQKVCRV